MKRLEYIIKKSVEMIIYVLEEHQVNPIFFGKNLFIRILYTFEDMQILNLIQNSMNLD